jgi:hypothetical protein
MGAVSVYLNALNAAQFAGGIPEGPLAALILNKMTLAANTQNGALAIAAQQELPGLLDELAFSVIARRRITSATVLALASAVASTGSYNVPDIGILGNLTISGGSIIITPGAY